MIEPEDKPVIILQMESCSTCAMYDKTTRLCFNPKLIKMENYLALKKVTQTQKHCQIIHAAERHRSTEYRITCCKECPHFLNNQDVWLNCLHPVFFNFETMDFDSHKSYVSNEDFKNEVFPSTCPLMKDKLPERLTNTVELRKAEEEIRRNKKYINTLNNQLHNFKIKNIQLVEKITKLEQLELFSNQILRLEHRMDKIEKKINGTIE